MRRTTIDELRNRKLAATTDAERVEFDETIASARPAIKIGEKIGCYPTAVHIAQRYLENR